MARFSRRGCHSQRRVEVDRVLDGLDPAAVRSTAFQVTTRLLRSRSSVDLVADIAFALGVVFAAMRGCQWTVGR